VQLKAPFAVWVAVHVAGVARPANSSLAKTCELASDRSSTVGASPTCDSPSAKDAVTRFAVTFVHVALTSVSDELKHVELDAGDVQPGLTRPGAQSVQTDPAPLTPFAECAVARRIVPPRHWGPRAPTPSRRGRGSGGHQAPRAQRCSLLQGQTHQLQPPAAHRAAPITARWQARARTSARWRARQATKMRAAMRTFSAHCSTLLCDLMRVAPRRAACRRPRRRAAPCVHGARRAFPDALARGARRCKCTCETAPAAGAAPRRPSPSASRLRAGTLMWASALCAEGG
jgi:hypothetical protein